MGQRAIYSRSTNEKKKSSFEDIDLSLTYSYAHYLTWLFDDRVELFNGKVVRMSPAPSPLHQEVSVNISSRLHNYLQNQACKIYYAPFDVRLPKKSQADRDIYTVLQPDICVICDQSKIDSRGCIGAPDIVVEILSPGNNRMELINKYQVYEEFGIKEYWIVSPAEKTFLKYILNEDGKYSSSGVFTKNDKFHSEILLGFELDLGEVFND